MLIEIDDIVDYNKETGLVKKNKQHIVFAHFLYLHSSHTGQSQSLVHQGCIGKKKKWFSYICTVSPFPSLTNNLFSQNAIRYRQLMCKGSFNLVRACSEQRRQLTLSPCYSGVVAPIPSLPQRTVEYLGLEGMCRDHLVQHLCCTVNQSSLLFGQLVQMFDCLQSRKVLSCVQMEVHLF